MEEIPKYCGAFETDLDYFKAITSKDDDLLVKARICLYAKYKEGGVNFAKHYLFISDPEEKEDAAKDIYIEAIVRFVDKMKNGKILMLGAKFSTVIYKFIKNDSINFSIKNGRESKGLDDYSRFISQLEEEDAKEKEEWLLALEKAKEQLSEQDRNILHKKYWENRNGEEIASELGIARGTVYNDLTDSRRALRNLLGLR